MPWYVARALPPCRGAAPTLYALSIFILLALGIVMDPEDWYGINSRLVEIACGMYVQTQVVPSYGQSRIRVLLASLRCEQQKRLRA